MLVSCSGSETFACLRITWRALETYCLKSESLLFYFLAASQEATHSTLLNLSFLISKMEMKTPVSQDYEDYTG